MFIDSVDFIRINKTREEDSYLNVEFTIEDVRNAIANLPIGKCVG